MPNFAKIARIKREVFTLWTRYSVGIASENGILPFVKGRLKRIKGGIIMRFDIKTLTELAIDAYKLSMEYIDLGKREIALAPEQIKHLRS
jgi:hypothetical protein